jgi:L,D-transpeptidase ErfK/SrfK
MRILSSLIVVLSLTLLVPPAKAEPATPVPVKQKTVETKAANVTAVVPAPDAASKPKSKTKKSKTAKAPKDQKNISAEGEDEEFPPAPDLDEGLPLPPYPPGAITAMGKMRTWTTGEEDTLLDVARHFNLGYVEMHAANPDVDAWAPLPGTTMTIPTFRLMPRAPQEGIVVNLAEMRLYYFKTPGTAPITYPIGIGRDGLMTPVGETQIISKIAGPVWRPTPRMRQEHSYLPESVPQGPMNPLGTHALYLGWKEFRIHGSNKPWAIGRRVSSGCMRMYPEDIIKLFNQVPVGTKVTVVEQPILVAWAGRKLYIEANPSRTQSTQLEIDGAFQPKELTEPLKKVILSVAGKPGAKVIDWEATAKAVLERRGYPVLIGDLDSTVPALSKKETPTPAAKPRPAAKPQKKPDVQRFNG